MANNGKYLALTAGRPTEENAVAASAGAGDAGKIVKLDAGGKLDVTMIPATASTETRSVIASEALAAGDFVNFHNNAGTVNMRKADADNNREAHGFVKAVVASAAAGTVYTEEAINDQLTGMTPGATQFLGTAAGARVEACPTGTGVMAQILGVAVSATEMQVRIETPILQA